MRSESEGLFDRLRAPEGPQLQGRDRAEGGGEQTQVGTTNITDTAVELDGYIVDSLIGSTNVIAEAGRVERTRVACRIDDLRRRQEGTRHHSENRSAAEHGDIETSDSEQSMKVMKLRQTSAKDG